MKISSANMKFSAYLAAIAVVSTLSLAAIFRYEKTSVARLPIADLHAAQAAYGKLPLSFQENVGQVDSRVRFVSRGPGYELFLTPQEAVLALRHPHAAPASQRERLRALRARNAARQPETASILRLRFAGADPSAELAGAERLPGRVDYFTGNDPKNWHTNVPSYSRVTDRSIYPGVDLVFYGSQRQLEYDFVVAPEADPKSIALEIEGASSVRIDEGGNLLMAIEGGEVELHRPVVYQQVGGARHEVPAGYALAGPNTVTFAVSAYDRRLPLVVDPVLGYSTYLGGSATGDSGSAIAVDANGDAFIAGQTFSTNFPTVAANAFNPGPITANQAVNGTVFVTEMNPAGTAELYSTYLTGSGSGMAGNDDGAFGIALDGNGNAYVTGTTFSVDFPTTAANAFNPGPEPSTVNLAGTAFLSKINPAAANGAASLVYSSFLGGTGGDSGTAVAADASGNAYIVGITFSTDFAPVNGIPSPPNAPGLPSVAGSAFLARVDTTKSGSPSLVYMTLLGGNGTNNGAFEGFAELATGVAVDASKDAYVSGITTSTGTSFPTTATALQTSANASNPDGGGFFSEINTAGTGSSALLYSTYLEGNLLDEANAIAIGPGGVAYITGDTASTNFPGLTNTTSNGTLRQGTFPSAASGLGIAFLTVIDPSKSGNNSLKYGVLLGGTNNHDIGFGVKADAAGNAYIAGGASSTDFPLTFGAFQTSRPNPNGDAFVAKINPAGNGTADLSYSSYFGGAGNGGGIPDQANGIAIDTATPPSAYITGTTASANTGVNPFPITTGAFQTTLTPNQDAFVAKLALIPRVSVLPSSINFGSVQIGTTSTPPNTITVTNNTSVMLTGLTFMNMGGNTADFAAAPDAMNGCGSTLGSGASCVEDLTFTPSAPASAEATTLDVNDSDSSSPQTVALSGMGTTVASNFTITAPATFQVFQGKSGTFNITVASVGGFNSPVALTFSGAPQNAGINISPSMVTPTPAMSASAGVTITTDVLVADSVPAAPSIPPSFGFAVASLFVVALFVAAFRRRHRMALGLAMLLVMVIAACTRSHHPITPLGTTPLTITGTSGNTMNSVQVNIMVLAN